jgi:undecaprenyl-diphosphatase
MRWVVAGRHPLVTPIMQRFTQMGYAGSITGTAGVLVLFPGTRVVGLVAFLALVLSQPVVHLLKRSLGRQRPVATFAPLCPVPLCFSFPSGHSSAAMCLAVALAAVLPSPIEYVAIAGALMVGLSRVYLGVHYPSDVAAGWMIGGSVAGFLVGSLQVAGVF